MSAVHECPYCGEMCDCDMEDHEQRAPVNCQHDCPDDHDDGFDDQPSDWDDD